MKKFIGAVKRVHTSLAQFRIYVCSVIPKSQKLRSGLFQKCYYFCDVLLVSERWNQKLKIWKHSLREQKMLNCIGRL
jgi:hypothetical protein